MELWYVKQFAIFLILAGCLVKPKTPVFVLAPSQLESTRNELKEELKVVIAKLVKKIGEYPENVNIFVEDFNEPTNSLLINVNQFLTGYGQDNLKQRLFLEGITDGEHFDSKSELSSNSSFTSGELNLVEPNLQNFKIVWINWNPASKPGIGKLIYALIGRQYQHASVLLIPKDAHLVVSKQGIPKIFQDGVEIPPLDYFSRTRDGDGDDFYNDRAGYAARAKAGRISFEYFEIDSDLRKQLKSFESSELVTRNPYIEYVGREQWDLYQKSRLALINLIGTDEEIKLHERLKSLAYGETIISKEKIAATIKGVLTNKTLPEPMVEPITEFWYKRNQLQQFENILSELKIPKDISRPDSSLSRHLKELFDPKHDLNYQDFKNIIRDVRAAIDKGTAPAEKIFKKFKPLLDHYTSQNFHVGFEKFYREMTDHYSSYRFLKKNCFTDACMLVKEVGGKVPNIKGYWIPDHFNRQIISQNNNIEIYSVKKVKNGVSINISDNFSGDNLNRARNIFSIIGLLSVGIPTTVIYQDQIVDKIQDQFNLAANDLRASQTELEQLLSQYVKISSYLHHLNLMESWMNIAK